ncbi:EEF1AKMT3 [Symbiodinium microadriaticum]|nr:EEF1AKMT3 [Symbiodinium microadriaticum]CAE7780520.1 EEF1AKMT3 [Symbiodinium sp. KB8]
MARTSESRLWTRKVEVDKERGLSISLIEDPTLDLGGDDAWCAWCLWPAAKALMNYLATMDDQVLKGSSILELGSGCGAVGMYAALRGAKPAILTDVYRALPLLKRNVAANGLGGLCRILALPWGTRLDHLAPEIRSCVPFDLVLAADCSYDFVNPETPSPSIDALLATAKSLGRRALICVSRRPHEVEAFTCSVERAGLSQMATVVYNEEMNAEKEGVPECLVYSFNFAESFQSRAGEC